MSKNKKDSAQKFDDIFGGEIGEENTEFDTSGFGDFNFDTSDEVFEFQENEEDNSGTNLQQFTEEYEEDYEEGEYLPVEADNSGSGNILNKAVTLAQENKIATVGLAAAGAFGLWKMFGTKKQNNQENVQQGSPNAYEDELLGLDDEEDSIDAFLDEQTQVNPMFTPLRFK